MAAGLDQFTYKPLSLPGEIRLLVVQSAKTAESITCSLRHVCLKDKPTYEALSYAWGDSAKVKTITCDGKEIHITKSLHDALTNLRFGSRGQKYSLRRHSRSRTIWADAICINQEDNAEKTIQVAMMAEIYSSADEVLIWLGADPEKKARAAFEAVVRSDKFLKKHATNYSGKGLPKRALGWHDSFIEQIDMPVSLIMDFSKMGLEALMPLLEFSWFKRRWVMQETILACKATVVFGQETLQWDVLGRVAEAFVDLQVQTYLDVDVGLHILENIATMHNIKQNLNAYTTGIDSGVTILDLVDNTAAFACSDPRDELFAILSLGWSKGFPPDYTLTANEVFRKFTLWSLRTHSDLEILSYAGVSNRTGHPSGLPTWIMAPSQEHEIVPYVCADHFHASAKGSADSDEEASQEAEPKPQDFYILGDDDTLLLQGAIVDQLEKLGDSFYAVSRRQVDSTDPAHLGPFGEEWRDWLFSCLALATPDHNALPQEQRDKLYRAMYCELDAIVARAPDEACQWFKWLLEDIVKGPRYKNELVPHHDEIDTMDVAIGRYAVRRRFCVTAEGRYAWVPELAESGDEICIVSGARIPFVMRRCKGGYSLIGECWVQGMMEGEALALQDFEWKEVGII